jgi:hypothetical protein
MKLKKHYRVYVVADDVYAGIIQFDAYIAVLSKDGLALIVDGIVFESEEGFTGLSEGWIN